MADTIVIETPVATVLEVSGKQGPQGPAGTGIETLTTKGDLLSRNDSEAIRVGIGSTGQVLKVSAQGLPTWANESGAVTSVNGSTGAVTVAAALHAADHEAGEADEIQAMAALVDTEDVSLNGIYVPNASGTTSGGRLVYYKTGTRENTKLEYNVSLQGWYLIKNTVVQLSGQEEGATHPWTPQAWIDDRSPQSLPNGGTVTRAPLEILARRAADGTSNVAVATTSADGLLSSSDKTKLNGIASGAEVNVNADWSATSGDAQILNKPSTFTPTAHTHGNLTNDGKLGSTAGLPVVTTTAGAVTTLALGTAGQVLRTKSDLSGVEFADPAASGVTGAAASASDVLGVSGSNITGVDANADRIIFWDDSASALKHLTVGSGLSISDTTISATATGTIGGSTGATDNAVLRADGTGGSTSQGSALIVSDFSNSTQETVAMSASVSGFAVTANATTDVFTAVGHNFIANQQVAFTSLTGGSGVDMTRPYYVRDISGDTFKLSFTRGTSALGISTDITAGTIVSAVGLVFRPQGFGGIMTAIPDGTSSNGNARGYDAVDLCNYRTGATQVASGLRSALMGGFSNLASGNNAVALGGSLHQVTGNDSFIGVGAQNTVSGAKSAIIGGDQNTCSATGTIALGGFQNQATADNALAFGRGALANRFSLMAHGNIPFAAIGDSQRIRAVLRCKTTTNAAVEMALDGGTTYLTIPSGKVIYAEIRIVGSKSDGSAVACYTRQYAAKNVAGTSTEVFAPVTIGTDNAAGTSLEVATVDAGDYIRIRPTGIASETWRWVASVDAVEVAYGT